MMMIMMIMIMMMIVMVVAGVDPGHWLCLLLQLWLLVLLRAGHQLPHTGGCQKIMYV